MLPVGGIKEKIPWLEWLTGSRHAIIPRQNSRDLEEIPKDLLRKNNRPPAVRHYDEVLFPSSLAWTRAAAVPAHAQKSGDSKTAKKPETETGVAAAFRKKAARKPFVPQTRQAKPGRKCENVGYKEWGWYGGAAPSKLGTEAPRPPYFL